MAKIYIAHNLEARVWLREIISKYLSKHQVTSIWIYDDKHVENESGRDNALADCRDIRMADILIICLDQFGERPGKGKWFEFGMAYALNKLILMVGEDKSCVFTNLPSLIWCKDWAQVKQRLDGLSEA